MRYNSYSKTLFILNHIQSPEISFLYLNISLFRVICYTNWNKGEIQNPFIWKHKKCRSVCWSIHSGHLIIFMLSSFIQKLEQLILDNFPLSIFSLLDL